MVVEIESAGLICSTSACTIELPVASTTFAEKENVPETVGVPLRLPLPLNDMPVGKLPAMNNQERVPEPPVAERAMAGYGWFTVPIGRVELVTTIGVKTVKRCVTGVAAE